MEKFLKFKDEIDLQELQNCVTDSRVVVLRKSQTTNTIQVRFPEGMSNKQIKCIFGPHEVEKVYNEFPYPIQQHSLEKFLVWPISRVLHR